MKKNNFGSKGDKAGLSSNTSEEVVEKEILKKLEKRNERGKEEQKEELKYENEEILNDNNSGVSNEKIQFIQTQSQNQNLNFNKKINLYNEKLGVYQYQYFSEDINNKSIAVNKFNPTSKISKYLLDKEESLNNILENPIPPNKIDLNFSEFINFRIFKYLDNYSDIYLNSSDLQFRQKTMNIYLFHILNHIMKRKEEIEIDDKIEKLIDRHVNKHEVKNILQEDLFVNEEEEFLKKYLTESELKNYASAKGEYFEEYRVLEKFKGKSNSNMKFTEADSDLIKDQGFTSPRVLILVPNKKHARLLVEEMVTILRKGNWKGISNKKKFKEEFSEMESMNDCFRMGISFDFFNNKLRLYQSFDNSDIIIASPLGLKLTSSSGNTNDPSVKNKKVFDFLSSIEILLIDFSEVFLYQNMDHLEEILSFLNKPPKNNQNIVNINRIKETVVNNLLQYTRQNIIISHFKTLEIEMILKRYCKNLAGGIYYLNERCENLIESIGRKENDEDDEVNEKSDQIVKYEFKILKTLDDSDLFDYKFTYFTKNIWQSLYDTFDRHTIIFASSALDYIRLKSFFKKNSVSVTYISEDTDKKDWQRNRLFFEEGRFKFLLYSERAHFYKKINLKFAKNIFFYSLPEDPSIFKEMIELIEPTHYKNSLEKYKIEDKNLLANNYSAVIALVTKLERYNLEKVVGTSTSNYIFRNKLDNYVC